MTVDEFLTKLSPKAQNILMNNRPKHDKTVQINIKDSFPTSIFYTDNGNYHIDLKENTIFSQMEYDFLHEYCHMIQKDNNIPFVQANREECSDMEKCINSMILDIDVTLQLIEWGFPFEDCDFKGHIDNLKNVIEIISRNDVNFSSDYSKILIYLEVVGHINIYKIFMNNDEIKSLIELCKTKNKILFDMLNYIEIITYNRDLNNPKDVHRIFRYIIKKYSLQDYLILPNTQINQ